MNEGLSTRKRNNPSSTVPHAMILDPDISAWAVRVYAYLDMRAGDKDSAFPGTETMANDMGVSIATVKRAIAELREKNWIKRVRRLGQSSITYMLQETDNE